MLKQIATILALGVLVSHTVVAQDTTLTATVTHIAGANVYLDIGTQDGIAKGDTVQIRDGRGVLGSVIIESAASQQSVLSFMGAAFSLTRGTQLTVVFSRTEIAPTPPVDTGPITNTESILQTANPNRSDSRSRTKQNRIKIRGRFLTHLSMLTSETKPQSTGLRGTNRMFFTPSVSINATMSNLPSDVKMHINIRSDYRYTSGSSTSSSNSFRAYQLSLEKSLPFGHVQFGRFYNRRIASGGYWDGLSLMYGSRKKGIGVSLGYMPDRSNEGFTTQFPRYSGFAHYDTSRQKNKPHYRISASYHEIQPNSQYQDHKFLGVEQEFDWGPVSFDQELQLDQNPATKSWLASLLQAQARVKVTEWLTVRSRVTSRQPYRIFSLFPVSTRRQHIQGGVNLSIAGARLGADYSVRFTEGNYESKTYVAYINSPLLTQAEISLFGSGSYWESDLGSALYLNGGMSKGFGAYLIRIDYGYYRSTNTNQIASIDVHRFTFSATLPFSKKFYMNLRGNLQQSQFLNSLSINTSIQYRF